MNCSLLSDVYAYPFSYPTMWVAFYILIESLDEQIHNFNIVKCIHLFIVINSFCVLFKKLFYTHFKFQVEIYIFIYI